MAISKPTLAAGATTKRVDFHDQPVQSASVAPGQSYTRIVDGEPVTFTTTASYEGQVYFQRIGDGFPFFYKMWVVVDDNGLFWAPVHMGFERDGYTGKQFDPMRSAS